jgi:beta propeller repeat protein
MVTPLLPWSTLAKQEVSVDTFTVVDRRNDQMHPRVDGSVVVWQDYRDIGARNGDEVNADIYARDLSTGDETKITDNHTASFPDVSDRFVVYVDKRNSDKDIRSYDLRRDESDWIVRHSGDDQDRPAIDDNIVVWQDNRDGSWDIRGKNLDNDDEFWVSHRDGNQQKPRISGHRVVWEDDRDGCCDIYLKDLDSGDVTRITDDNDAREPDIAGNWIVYRRGDDPATIWAYNVETGDRIRVSSTRDEARQQPSVSGRLVAWADRRNGDDFNVYGFDLDSKTEFLIRRADDDQIEPAVSGERVVWTTASGDRSADIRGATVTFPSVPATPTPTPVPQPGNACPPSGAAVHDARYFPATGYRVDNDTIWNYFNARGGIRNFGYPVSRTVTFMGFTTQFFQRQVVQITQQGAPQLVNLLDPDVMPATTINFSTYPAVDPGLKADTPPVSDPLYATRIIDFTRQVAPDTWNGLPVRFFSTFVGQVTLADAFPFGGGNAALLPLLNLELSGAPISRPAADPNNAGFVYQRFQRTILHYDSLTGITQPVLLADNLKAVLQGRAPADLMNQMQGSRFISQYNPAQPNALNRPDLLPMTNLCGAFEPQ